MQYKSMQYKKWTILLVSIIFVCSFVTVVALQLQNREQSVLSNSKREIIDDSQFPIADYDNSNKTNLGKHSERQTKAKKYDPPIEAIAPGVTTYQHYHWPLGFSALPVAQSDAVVIGKVSDAKAYLSANKQGVYSEFSVVIEQVLKDSNLAGLTSGNTISTERAGGRVQFPSGQMGRQFISGWGMPRGNYRYILFLKHNAEDSSYSILTGYELREGHVYPVDKSTSSEINFATYTGWDEIVFLNTLQDVIKNSSQTQKQ